MNVSEYLKKVAFIGDSGIKDDDGKIYYSNFDKSYITRVGMERGLEFFAKHEITNELTHGAGFSPKDNKWYGWSHRSIYGFEIGSTCREGDCHYIGSDIDEQEKAAIRFWTETDHLNVRCEGIIQQDGKDYFDIKWNYSKTVPNESIREAIGGCLHRITPLGRGEWIAKTMEDAKQMAIDFNEGVS